MYRATPGERSNVSFVFLYSHTFCGSYGPRELTGTLSQDACYKQAIEARLRAHHKALANMTASTYSNNASAMDNSAPVIYPHLETRAKKVFHEQGTRRHP